MAERFQAQMPGFRWLFRTFGGPTSPTEMDVASPVQPVADITRLAGRGYYIRSSLAVSAVGAGTARQTFLLRSSLPLFQAAIDPDQVDVWLTSWGMIVDAATRGGLDSGHLAYIGSTLPPTQPTEDEPFPIAAWYIDDGVETVVGQGVGVRQVPGYRDPGRIPILIRPDNDQAGIYFAVSTNAALTFARVLLELWIGPRESTPPGMS